MLSIVRKAAHVLPLLLFLAALIVVRHEIKVHQISDILGALKSVPLYIVLLAIGLTVFNYIVLAGYDYLALRYTGHKIPLQKIALASLIGYAISNNTGHALATGGSVRYRFYSAWGVPGWDVLKISFFLGVTYMLGVLTLGLAGTLMLPAGIRFNIKNPELIEWIAIASSLALALYWLLVVFWRKPLAFKGFEFRLPSISMTISQTVVSSIDVILSSLVLWVLLKDYTDLNFITFLVIFVIAQVSGLISQVPGGIGVFESAFLWLMAAMLVPEQHLAVVSALILYRIVYYFIPLLMAGFSLLAYEVYIRRKTLIKSGSVLHQALSTSVPQIFSLLLLFTGGVLLVYGATPNLPRQVEWLRDFIPLPIFEISHLLGSLTGLLLLFLARGIHLRLDAAWYASILFLGLGIIVAQLQGQNWQETALLVLLLVFMSFAKSYFHRQSSLFRVSFNAPWLMMIFTILIGSSWLGFFAYRHVEYSQDLWWQFSYQGDAPRFLRAQLVLTVMITCFAAYRLFAVAHPKIHSLPDKDEMDEAAALVIQKDDTKGFLALLGDKYLFWSDDRKAFIMFASTAKYWIAMSDPVGDKNSFEELLWRFKENAYQYGAQAVFYQITDKHLPLYLDLGLVLFKMGEEAHIDLQGFTLKGKTRENLRGGRNRLMRLDYSFDVLEQDAVQQNIHRLKDVSDAWMLKKNAKEKGFSLGFFDEFYLRRTRIAVARDRDGKIMAFANLWETAGKELSIDIMRYDTQSPGRIMDYLFAELMLWGKEQGFATFSLGMAPLYGLERRPLAPLWHKIGTAIFDLGDEFYNFEGLCEYKAKFHPSWHPRYLAIQSSLSGPLIMMAVTRLISGSGRNPH
ncbi:MAG: hypothetical protein COA85_06790 [Robiginitomaculum sp.]|nr:MAG: hypothetical protein COA85_06790 [Robiginitomaculum sp.]